MKEQEGYTETLTFEQFMQEMKCPGRVQSAPVVKQEPAPGAELLKRRVRVSFDFDVTVNDAPIRNAGEDAIGYDLALLQSFLKADKTKLLHRMVDTIATQLGLNSPETFIAQFLPQVDTNSHILFSEAIDALSGEHGAYWRDIAETKKLEDWQSYLDICTEKIFKCFEAKFVKSQFQTIEGDAPWTV
jgi:hypothetical protein